MTEALYADPCFAGMYDAQHADAALGGRADFAFVRRMAEGARSVLDLGCGTGELAAQLAGGRAVVGVDPAAAMLEVARARPGGDRVTWIEAEAGAIALGRRFDLIAMTGHAFQCLLSDEAILAVLRAVRRHLEPGGRFVFDSRNPMARYWEAWDFADAFEGPEGTVRRWTSAQEDGGIVTYAQRFELADGSVRKTSARLRSASRERLEEMVAEAGLRVRAVHGDWSGAAWGAGSPEIVMVVGP